jgi:hypothetical protein
MRKGEGEEDTAIWRTGEWVRGNCRRLRTEKVLAIKSSGMAKNGSAHT